MNPELICAFCWFIFIFSGKVVSLTHWPPLPPGNTPGTHFF